MRNRLYLKSAIARVLNIGVILFAISFIFGLSCQTSQSTPAPAPAPTATSGAAGIDIELTARYPSFQPSTFTVPKGNLVKVTITSLDTPHTFTIDELGINLAVGAGQTASKEFTVEKTGTFVFYCAVQGHRGAGMQGTLEVRGEVTEIDY